MAQHHSFTRAFFLHTLESILFFNRFYSEIWTAKLVVGRWQHLVRRYARAFDIPPLLIGMPLLRSLVSMLFLDSCSLESDLLEELRQQESGPEAPEEPDSSPPPQKRSRSARLPRRA